MEPVLRPLRRRFALMADLFWKILAIVRPPTRQVRTARVCPFCGLITSRSKRSCLECDKILQPV